MGCHVHVLDIFCVIAWENLVWVLGAGRKDNIESAVNGTDIK